MAENRSPAERRWNPGRRDVKRYVHSGGYNRLAGRSTAPGSLRPPGFYVKRRVVFIIFGVLFFGTALWFVLF